MPRLLIVDDDPVDREQVARCLEPVPDLELFEAEDGDRALAVLDDEEIDLVLTDLRMPNLDGLELVRAVKERHPLLPVILVTSHGSELDAVEALAAGAASYVAKADLVDHLPEKINQVLSVVEAKRERSTILRSLESSVSHFRLASDPALIAPFVALVQEELEGAGFSDAQGVSQIGTALSEAISNAIVHGNLEVSSELRTDGSENYHRRIEERIHTEPWASREVTCTVRHTPEAASYVVRDEGSGFDPSVLPDPTKPENMLKACGRGLFLIHSFMDEIEHNDAGNEIRMTKRLTPDKGED